MNENELYFIKHLVSILNQEAVLTIIKTYSSVLTIEVLTFPFAATDDSPQGELVLTYLLSNDKGIELLTAWILRLSQLDLDTVIAEGNDAGASVLWVLLHSHMGKLLFQLPHLFKHTNLNAAPSQGPHAGKTVLWWLAATPDGLQLLLQHPEWIDRSDLNAGPSQGTHAGKTVLWILAATPDGLQLLLQHPEWVERSDLNATPSQGPHAGATVLWWLAATLESQQLLLQHPEWIDRSDLNAGPSQGTHAGITVLWWLASTPDGQQFLLQHPEWLGRSNLNATLIQGPEAGITVLWMLAASPESRQLLLQHPEWLDKADLNAGPSQGHAAGKTILGFLATTAEGRQLIHHHCKDNFVDLSASCETTLGKTTVIEQLLNANNFQLVKDSLRKYVLLDKQSELNRLIALVPHEIAIQISSMIDLIYAENDYQGLVTGDKEDIKQLTQDADECLQHINRITHDAYYYKDGQSLKALLLMAISSYGIYSLPSQSEQQRFLKTDSLKTQNTVDIVVAMANAGQITELANFLTDRLNNTKPALEDEVQDVGIAKKRPFSMLETSGFFNPQSTYSHVFNHDKKEDEDQDNHVNDETPNKRQKF